MNAKRHLSKIGPLDIIFPLPGPSSQFHVVTEPGDDDEDEPKKREVCAYKVELAAKVVYPILFGFFNLWYWSYYLHYYAISEHLFNV